MYSSYMMAELRYAGRQLLRHRGLTAAAVLCIGLGVGANAVLFGVVDALLFRPPAQVGQPHELVRVSARAPGPPGVPSEFNSALSYPAFELLRDQVAGFAGVAAYAGTDVTLGAGSLARRLSIVLASPDYFRVLRVRSALGRFPESKPGAGVFRAEPEVVLSDGYWRRAYGGRTDVVGETMQLNGRPFTVVGVAPRGFVGPELGSPDLWAPLGSAVALGMGEEMMRSPNAIWLSVIARLKPGVTRIQAENMAVGSLAPLAPGAGGAARLERLAGLRATDEMASTGPRGTPVSLWFLAVTLAVLLIACANVANLVLARAVHRRPETVIRLAIGASRWRIVREMLLESAMLSLLGGVAAVLLARWGETIVHRLPLPPLPSLIDWRTLLLTFGLCAVTTLAIGLLPALWSSRADLSLALKSGVAQARSRRVRARDALMVTQLAAAFVLLVGALVFVRSLRAVRAIDPGYDLNRQLAVWLELPEGPGPPFDAEAFAERALARLRTVPGVEAVGTSATVPFRMFSTDFVRIPGATGAGQRPLMVSDAIVGVDFFDALGIPLVAGRGFTPADRVGTPPVAVVSETMAKRFWAGQSPLGRCFQEVAPPGAPEGPCIEVVGVAGNARFERLLDDDQPYFYLPFDQFRSRIPPIKTLHVRTRGPAGELAASVHAAVQGLDPDLPFVRVEPLRELVREQVVPWEMGVLMFSLFGLLALVLASVGLYGLVSFVVSERTRELGVRMALGAQRRDILGLVLGQVTRLTAIAVLIGLLGAALLVRMIGTMMYGVRATDPVTYVGTALLLGSVALLAAMVPARRAARANPMSALRAE